MNNILNNRDLKETNFFCNFAAKLERSYIPQDKYSFLSITFQNSTQVSNFLSIQERQSLCEAFDSPASDTYNALLRVLINRERLFPDDSIRNTPA